MIFVSYSREDRQSALHLLSACAIAGVPLAVDPPLIEGDPFWRRNVAEALEQANEMIVLWSAAAARSPWVDQELRNFTGRTVLLRLDATPAPPALADAAPELQRMLHRTPEHRAPPDDDEVATGRRIRFAEEAVRLRNFISGQKGSVKYKGAIAGDGTELIAVARGVYLAARPVSNEQYEAFIAETAYPPPPTWADAGFRDPAAPVAGVTWFEAAAYAAWAGAALPTAETWRLAAGETEFATPSGRLSEEEALFGLPFPGGVPVDPRRYPPSTRGFFGLSGNTWDWCATAHGNCRVIRGGSFLDSTTFCRTSAWYRNSPIDRDCTVGFRLAINEAEES